MNVDYKKIIIILVIIIIIAVPAFFGIKHLTTSETDRMIQDITQKALASNASFMKAFGAPFVPEKNTMCRPESGDGKLWVKYNTAVNAFKTNLEEFKKTVAANSTKILKKTLDDANKATKEMETSLKVVTEPESTTNPNGLKTCKSMCEGGAQYNGQPTAKWTITGTGDTADAYCECIQGMNFGDKNQEKQGKMENGFVVCAINSQNSLVDKAIANIGTLSDSLASAVKAPEVRYL